MKIALVFIVALLSVNAMSLMEKYPINFSQKRSIMTLLTQVEAQLKAGGPLDAITDLLQGFLTTITEEQVNHDLLWESQQADCADEEEFRSQEISNANAALQESTETLNGCQSQKIRAEGDLVLTKKQLNENRNFLAQVEDTRRRQAYTFETEATAYALVNSAIDEALVILQEIFEGNSSFVQLSRHMNGVLKSTIRVKKAHLMTGLMAALVQLSAQDLQADEELLNKVKSLLEGFRTKLEEGLAEAVAFENQSIAEYDEEKARLSTTVAALEAQQTGLVAETDELNKCIIVQSSIVSNATTKRDRNQHLLDDSTALCTSVEEEYRVATQSRAAESELLAAIRERVEIRFAQIQSGAAARGSQDSFEYDNQNDYERETFTASV